MILVDDEQAPPKQRHTCRRIFERLRDEHGTRRASIQKNVCAVIAVGPACRASRWPVEVDQAYYSVPPEYLGERVWVPGRFSTQRAYLAAEKISKVESGAVWLLSQVCRIGHKPWLGPGHASGPRH